MKNQLNNNELKHQVKDFWEEGSCGENLYLSDHTKEAYLQQSQIRYQLEPYIIDFANFEKARGKKVLEIGLGLGADHQQFAENGADLYGVDLTIRSIEHVRHRFNTLGLTDKTQLQVGDAENLPFADNSFDWVYSWGVIHHSPNTPRAAQEILRVLRPGGTFKVMVYHKYSCVGFMLWLRYAAFKGRLWTSLDEIYSRYLESPGTKAYTVNEAKELFKEASSVHATTVLTHGDLLESAAGQRHQGQALEIARKIWPRRLIKACFKNNGLFLMLEGTK